MIFRARNQGYFRLARGYFGDGAKGLAARCYLDLVRRGKQAGGDITVQDGLWKADLSENKEPLS